MKEFLFGQTSCIILSAGSSERMGEPKALLRFSEDEMFIQKITRTYIQSGVKQVIVVVNTDLYNSIHKLRIPLADEVELVVNRYPEKGRFYSLQAGVQKLKTGNSCFFQNIDNPFTSDEVLKSLFQCQKDADVIIPVYDARSGHPVLFSWALAQEIIDKSDPEIRIDHFLQAFATIKVEITENRILTNINSHEDFLEAGLGK
jgi:CTP:molybdopterin cytidylyltransferase MocA